MATLFSTLCFTVVSLSHAVTKDQLSHLLMLYVRHIILVCTHYSYFSRLVSWDRSHVMLLLRGADVCLFTTALEIAKAHNQDLQVVGSCPSECVCATIFACNIQINSLDSLNYFITSGSARQAAMEQVLVSYIVPNVYLCWEMQCVVSAYINLLTHSLVRKARHWYKLKPYIAFLSRF